MKVAYSIVNARREELSHLLRIHRYLPIPEICRRLNISEATARRDLAVLSRDQRAMRTHGGALGDFNATFASFQSRKYRARRKKEKIAKMAVSKMKPGSTCFVDAGTTMLALAEKMVTEAISPLRIVTNNVPVAEILSIIEGIEIFLLGGQFFSRQGALLGPEAILAVRQWRFDAAFLGAEGLTDEGAWNSHPEIIRLQKAVMACTATSYLCMDDGKWGHRTSHFLLDWGEIPHLISDASPRTWQERGIPFPSERITSGS